jgi:hypothetical protein
MAIRHGLAGQYPKAEATRLRDRDLFTICVVAILIGGICGFLLGGGLTWLRGAAGVAAVCVGLPIMYFSLRRFEKFIDASAKERIKYMRGGQAEALVAWILEDLPDSYHIFNGLKLYKDSDIDHIVVGPQGLFCISTKSVRGLFEMRDDKLFHNGRECHYAQQARSQAGELANRLQALRGAPVPWVQAVLAVPFAYIEGPNMTSKLWIVHQDDIIELLDPIDAKGSISSGEVASTVHALELLYRDAAQVQD